MIDWFTVVAQVVNFLVLVYLLQRFLYAPIVRAMETREKRVLSRLEEARQQREEAEQERAAYHQKRQEWEAQHDQMLNAARKEANEERRRLLQEARDEGDRLTQRWHESLRRGKEEFLHHLRQRVSEQVLAVARRVLTDLADADLEQRMVAVFLERLRQLDEERQETLRAVAHASQQQGQVIVQSAFPLSPGQQQHIARSLREQRFIGENGENGNSEVTFETAADLLCGVRLVPGNHEVSWCLQSYLETLERDIARTFEEEEQQGEQQGEQQAEQQAA
ncbi:MAG: F0F1 ATP synthase subunit B [Chloroflexaceae bacterium]|nr:F0F1 ATP synthase subunit B [Chloroflexaceae bacterium]